MRLKQALEAYECEHMRLGLGKRRDWWKMLEMLEKFSKYGKFWKFGLIAQERAGRSFHYFTE